MIKIVKNESFPDWVQLFVFDNFVEEYKNVDKALRIAKKLAKHNNISYLQFFDQIIATE